MTELSEDTLKKLESLFPEHLHEQARHLLIHECGNNLPFCEGSDKYQMERIQLAALKVSNGDIEKLNEAILLAQEDCRDLLMNAGFGEDTEAHKK